MENGTGRAETGWKLTPISHIKAVHANPHQALPRDIKAWLRALHSVCLQGTGRWRLGYIPVSMAFPAKCKREKESSLQTSESILWSILHLRAPLSGTENTFFAVKWNSVDKRWSNLHGHQDSSSFLPGVATHWDNDQIWPREGWVPYCQEMKDKWRMKQKNPTVIKERKPRI